MKKLLLLDAYALIFRAFYAMIRSPRVTSTGIDTSAVFGFVNTLHDLLTHEEPTHIAVCFDPGGKTFRHEAYPDYKANRSATPEGILIAVPYIKRILEAYRIPVIQVEGYEADDVIGTLAHQAQEQDFFTYMVTGDKDFGQLVTPQVKILNPAKHEVLGVEEVNEKYGLKNPKQVIDLLALMGDSADNIPGCPGVGPKTAEKLIQQYGSVENLLEHSGELKGALKTKVESNVEQIRFSKYLATIVTDAPVTLDEAALRRGPADLDALRQVFAELEFRTLTARIIDQAEATQTPPQGAPAVGAHDSGANDPEASHASAGRNAASPHSAPSPAPSQPGEQLSLFDQPAPQNPPCSREHEASHERECFTGGGVETAVAYTIVSDFDEATQLVQRLLALPRVAVYAVADGAEAMRATLLGFAVCGTPGQAVYLPLDGMGWMLQAVAPLFAGRTCIVSGDVKRMMVMLHVAGVEMTAPYYDTAVAHYLLQPERGHALADVAADLLHRQLPTPESVTGGKGRKQLNLSQAHPDALRDYACAQADAALQLPDLLDRLLEQEQMTHLLTDIELPLIEVLAHMEMAGARIDCRALEEYALTLTNQIADLEQECWTLAGEQFNTASPAQVGEVLFDKLHLDDKAKKTKTGQYSTTEEVLQGLRHRHPVVDKILDLRGKRKLLSTYVNALPQLVNPRTGRIHTTFNQTVTATGRLSSTNPNLQNIPVRSDEGREIRRAFIPADGNVFFSADYSQIELRLVADMSHDPAMLAAFAQGHDIHAITASHIYHEPLEKVTPEQRRRAKTANFGILYGISSFGLSQRLDIPRSEAKQLIEGYFATFPGVRDYIDRSVAQARERGFVTTLYGRRRMLPDINSRNAVVRAFSERNAVNAPIQGTAADVIKRAMVAIYRRFKAEGLRSQMILQVHDELNFDVFSAELERVQHIVVTEMEAAYEGGVRLTATHAAASNWLDAH